jgi:hypothetical protein
VHNVQKFGNLLNFINDNPRLFVFLPELSEPRWLKYELSFEFGLEQVDPKAVFRAKQAS